ncbi:yl-1 protein transcription factor-like [Anaeramoeba flamelloides]|uniref:Yl-1 protein transcription factor-like n=1 Tax=Anaeramoeba flamelloides TaxID=1746091 RepID=A0AAV7YME5_9EUKA|nr:yl-1 protein transcription factor-like [Anaeramoeba flamelloides]
MSLRSEQLLLEQIKQLEGKINLNPTSILNYQELCFALRQRITQLNLSNGEMANKMKQNKYEFQQIKKETQHLRNGSETSKQEIESLKRQLMIAKSFNRGTSKDLEGNEDQQFYDVYEQQIKKLTVKITNLLSMDIEKDEIISQQRITITQQDKQLFEQQNAFDEVEIQLRNLEENHLKEEQSNNFSSEMRTNQMNELKNGYELYKNQISNLNENLNQNIQKLKNYEQQLKKEKEKNKQLEYNLEQLTNESKLDKNHNNQQIEYYKNRIDQLEKLNNKDNKKRRTNENENGNGNNNKFIDDLIKERDEANQKIQILEMQLNKPKKEYSEKTEKQFKGKENPDFDKFEIEEKDFEIKKLNNQLQLNIDELNDLREELEEKDDQISKLRSDLLEKNEDDNLFQDRKKHNNSKFKNPNDQILENQNEIITQLRKDLMNAESVISDQDNKIQDLKNSTKTPLVNNDKQQLLLLNSQLKRQNDDLKRKLLNHQLKEPQNITVEENEKKEKGTKIYIKKSDDESDDDSGSDDDGDGDDDNDKLKNQLKNQEKENNKLKKRLDKANKDKAKLYDELEKEQNMRIQFENNNKEILSQLDKKKMKNDIDDDDDDSNDNDSDDDQFNFNSYQLKQDNDFLKLQLNGKEKEINRLKEKYKQVKGELLHLRENYNQLEEKLDSIKKILEDSFDAIHDFQLNLDSKEKKILNLNQLNSSLKENIQNLENEINDLYLLINKPKKANVDEAIIQKNKLNKEFSNKNDSDDDDDDSEDGSGDDDDDDNNDEDKKKKKKLNFKGKYNTAYDDDDDDEGKIRELENMIGLLKKKLDIANNARHFVEQDNLSLKDKISELRFIIEIKYREILRLKNELGKIQSGYINPMENELGNKVNKLHITGGNNGNDDDDDSDDGNDEKKMERSLAIEQDMDFDNNEKNEDDYNNKNMNKNKSKKIPNEIKEIFLEIQKKSQEIQEMVKRGNSQPDSKKEQELERKIRLLEKQLESKNNTLKSIKNEISQFHEFMDPELKNWISQCLEIIYQDDFDPNELTNQDINQFKEFILEMLQNDQKKIFQKLLNYKKMEKKVLEIILKKDGTEGLQVALRLLGINDLDFMNDDDDDQFIQNKEKNKNYEDEDEDEIVYDENFNGIGNVNNDQNEYEFRSGTKKNILLLDEGDEQRKRNAKELERKLQLQLQQQQNKISSMKKRFIQNVLKLIRMKKKNEEKITNTFNSLNQELEKLDKEIEHINKTPFKHKDVDEDFIDDFDDDFSLDFNTRSNNHVLEEEF